jgi:hypothetical protein
MGLELPEIAILMVLSKADARAHPDPIEPECTQVSCILPNGLNSISVAASASLTSDLRHQTCDVAECLAADEGDRLAAPVPRALNFLGDFLEIFSKWYDTATPIGATY